MYKICEHGGFSQSRSQILSHVQKILSYSLKFTEFTLIWIDSISHLSLINTYRYIVTTLDYVHAYMYMYMYIRINYVYVSLLFK